MIPTAVNHLGFPFLTIILWIPAAGAAGILLFLEDVRAIRITASVIVVLNFVLSMALLILFKEGTATSGWVFQFADKQSWIPTLGINYWVGVDGISVFLVGLTCLMMAIAVLAANFMIANRVKAFMVFMLFLETAVLGVFVSLNLFLFYVFWEAMLIPMYFLLGMWGEEHRQAATMKFLIYTIFGSFLMLVAIFYLWTQTGTLDMVGPAGLIAHRVGSSAQFWLFLAFGIAFAVKMPIWPFHTWAPAAYREAPLPVVIALAGILSKAGAFGFLRYSLPLFPSAARELAAFVSILAIVGLLYAAILALTQRDIKLIVAYSSISHMNLIALGIFALNPIGFDGSVLQMINHSIIISGLFLVVAFIGARTGTRWLPAMGGLGIRWPMLMWLFFVFVLAALDLPGLGSFAGEFLILIGLFRTNGWFAAIAALVVIVAAWYMIRFFQDTMNGPETEPAPESEPTGGPARTVYDFPPIGRLIRRDLVPREIGLLVPLILLILYLGIQPFPFTQRLNATTNSINSSVHHTVSSAAAGGGR